MPIMRDLDSAQIGEVLRSAAEKLVPVVITVKGGEHWVNLHSRMIALGAGYCWLEMPAVDRSGSPYEFEVTDQIAISFKLKHYKYLFVGTVAEIRKLQHEQIDATEAMCIYIPEKMQRISRRVFERVDVPPGKIVRVTFWQGGREAEPNGPSPQNPVFLGTVTNVSGGGFQARTDLDARELFEIGDVIGARIVFGAAEETMYADCQFRHAELQGDSALIGFQFVGMGRHVDDQAALRLLSRKISEYQRSGDKSADEADAIVPVVAVGY